MMYHTLTIFLSDVLFFTHFSKIWAYVSCYNDYICDDMVFVYDKLDVSKESADIETHFETTEYIPSTAAKFDILVLTIIPANQ